MTSDKWRVSSNKEWVVSSGWGLNLRFVGPVDLNHGKRGTDGRYGNGLLCSYAKSDGNNKEQKSGKKTKRNSVLLHFDLSSIRVVKNAIHFEKILLFETSFTVNPFYVIVWICVLFRYYFDYWDLETVETVNLLIGNWSSPELIRVLILIKKTFRRK